MAVDLEEDSGSILAMSDPVDPIFEVEGASVTFDMDRGETRVLDDVSFFVERNETLGIVGESGSGKSMCASALLNAVVEPGILWGDVYYYPEDGDRINLMEYSTEELKEIWWNEIAMIVQSAQSAFNPTMTIRDHFIETLNAHGENIEDGMARGVELLEDLYLNPDQVLDSHPHELSGGMKQRALVALGLLLEPGVLVMDEPTAALDLLMQRSIITLLEEIKEKYEVTMVFVTHDLPVVAELADRLAVMYAFEIVEVGPTDAIINDAAHPYTRALINSVPNIVAPVDEMKAIPGSSPDPINIPEGCSYHRRCPISQEHCEVEDPEFYRVGDSHLSSCFYPETAQSDIPLSLEVDHE